MKANRIRSIIKTPTYVLKEFFHRKPQSGFRWNFVSDEQKPTTAGAAAELERDGITILPGHFKGEQLKQLRAAFDPVVKDHPDKSGNPDAYLNPDIMSADPAFLRAATDDAILDIISRYYRKPFALGSAMAFRLDPTDSGRYGSFQWHHDGRGRQIHAMILTEDMPEDGQRMVYLRGTHKRYYDHYRGTSPEGSRFENDLISKKYADEDVQAITGPAGTVAIFDANGLHSGNRNNVARRDCLLYIYVTSRNVRDLAYRKQDVEALPDAKRFVITRNPKHRFV